MTPTDLHRRAEDLAAPLPPLLVAAERVAATVFSGVHGRRRVGPGDTFWQFRRYHPGDSPRRVDWRRSARSESVFVRETEWAAAQSLWLWRDGSASMDWRSHPTLPTKRERADLLAAALACLLVKGGERVALLGRERPPSSDRFTLRHLARDLEDASAGPEGAPPAAPLPSHARVVLIGDFLDPLERLEPAVSALSGRGVRGHVLQVLDPAEETLPYAGRVRFQGVEDEGDLLTGRAQDLQEAYRTALTRHRLGLESLAARRGWTISVHHTGHPAETALLTLYMALAARMGG